jgi:hypothetical protein
MPNSPKPIKAFVVAAGWLASVFPTVWAAVLTALGSVVLLLLTEGAKLLSNPEFLGAALLFVLVLWSYIALVWLWTRKPRDVVALRHGITFEGVTATFNPATPEAALSFALNIRNFCPVPIRYYVESFDVKIETRTLPKKYESRSLQGFLSRGAGRVSSAVPFTFDHIKEFLGRRLDGSLDFSIIYGDADRQPVRRLTMSIQLFLQFPALPTPLPMLPNASIAQGMFPLGFGHNIQSENDEPMNP